LKTRTQDDPGGNGAEGDDLVAVPGLDSLVDNGLHAGLHIGVDLLAEEFEPAEGHKADQAGHAATQDRVQEDLVADVLDVDLLDKAVGDDARGGHGGEGAGVGPVADHEGHQEGADPGLAGQGHADGSEDDGGGDVAGADRGQDAGQDEEDDGEHAHVAAGPFDRPPGQFLDGAVDGGHAEEHGRPDEDHEQPQGEELVEVRHLQGAARRQRDDEGKGDAHDADVFLGYAADHDGDDQRNQGNHAQGVPADRIVETRHVAAHQKTGHDHHKWNTIRPFHKDSLRIQVG
jgi:hypothetical protein